MGALFIDDSNPSDNGPTARKFFDDKNREHILDLFPTVSVDERAALDRLLSYSNVICRVVNSSRRVQTEEFGVYVLEAYLYRITIFDFWPLNDSVHRIWSHVIERIKELYGFSLGLVSECALERSVSIRYLFMGLNT